MTTPILQELNAFYDEHGILPVRFRCPSRRRCSDDSPNFTEAKASLVGPLYEERRLPRLLFLSLHPSRAERLPERRTAEFQRRDALVEDVAALPKHKHWYRTHEMAFILLRQFKPDIEHPKNTKPCTPRDVRVVSYIAHVNSAKCCQNKEGRAKADRTLLKNCRRFIRGELEVLRPDVVVTQGNEAEAAIRTLIRQPTVRKRIPADNNLPAHFKRCPARYETGFIDLGPSMKRALWLQAYQPRSGGYFWRQYHLCWPRYAEDVGRFWNERQKQHHRLH